MGKAQEFIDRPARALTDQRNVWPRNLPRKWKATASMADSSTDNFDRDFNLSLLSSDQDVIYEIEEALKRSSGGRTAFANSPASQSHSPGSRLSLGPVSCGRPVGVGTIRCRAKPLTRAVGNHHHSGCRIEGQGRGGFTRPKSRRNNLCKKQSSSNAEAKEAGKPVSRYMGQRNKKTQPDRLEMKKYNPNMRRHTLHREIK